MAQNPFPAPHDHPDQDDPGGYGDTFSDMAPNYYEFVFDDPRFATREALRHAGRHPQSGPFAQYIQNQMQGDDLLTLYGLHQPRSAGEVTLADPQSLQDYAAFSRDYIGAMAGRPSSLTPLGFGDVGQVLADFVTGSGKYAQTQTYEVVAEGIRSGNPMVEYQGLRDVIFATSYTMSDIRQGAILGTLDDLFHEYINSGVGGTFTDYLASTAADAFSVWGWSF